MWGNMWCGGFHLAHLDVFRFRPGLREALRWWLRVVAGWVNIPEDQLLPTPDGPAPAAAQPAPPVPQQQPQPVPQPPPAAQPAEPSQPVDGQVTALAAPASEATQAGDGLTAVHQAPPEPAAELDSIEATFAAWSVRSAAAEAEDARAQASAQSTAATTASAHAAQQAAAPPRQLMPPQPLRRVGRTAHGLAVGGLLEEDDARVVALECLLLLSMVRAASSACVAPLSPCWVAAHACSAKIPCFKSHLPCPLHLWSSFLLLFPELVTRSITRHVSRHDFDVPAFVPGSCA